MSMPNGFASWIGFILIDEGAEVNRDPDEPGGISKYGVSLLAYADYCKANAMSAPTSDVIAGLLPVQAMAFYQWFFGNLMLDLVPVAIAYRIADLTTSLGRGGVVVAVCESLGIWPIPTAMTAAIVSEINAVDQRQLIWALSACWLTTKRCIGKAGAVKYGHGWNARRNVAHGRAIAMVTT